MELNQTTVKAGLRYGLNLAFLSPIVDKNGRPVQFQDEPNYKLDGGQPLLANPLAPAEHFPVDDRDQHWTRWLERVRRSGTAARTRSYMVYLWVRVTNLL